MYIDDQELRGLYKTSAAEHVQAIESALMQLERQPQNLAPVKELLRSAHTLKGDSRMLGVENVETLVHQIEECLMPIEKGQEQMTEELCDRLYAGLDSIKQLAHTAVTGEPNDVNMFYVLATLMGDGLQMPTIPMVASSLPVDVAPSPSELDDSGSFGWITLSDEEAIFDAPKDLWIHEDNTSPISDTQQPLWSNGESLPAAAPSQLQANFWELAAELFSPDSTLPQLESDTVFNDFTILPGTSQPPESAVTAELFVGEASLKENGDDEFMSLLSQEPLGDATIDSLDLGDEDFLFSDFDATLLPLSGDLSTIEGTFSERSIADLEMTPTVVEPVVIDAPATPSVAAANASEYQIDTIRVEAKQLDTLMGQSGEINVLNQQIVSRLVDLDTMLELWEEGTRDSAQIQSQIQQLPFHSPLYRQLQQTAQQWEQMGALISKFKKSLDSDSSRLDVVTSALDSGVKQLRLLPLSTIFNLFPRMVRDLAKTQSKEINFAIEGGDLLLDKRLLEEIKDPLMHLIRNAIDHGIEPPAERQLSDKPSAANLTIRVQQTGSQTTIEILDDGRGLDIQRIKATAIKRGLHTSAELDQMSVERVQSLIFAS
ncbi:Hpt domain-containing protein, partial [Chamaesiphon sp. OTE_8_metabat_110]|uniref:chemotaxis protein CheA n=1 Tax=Chamaesiphon sp. OTE_8_metabat_110 TaxID=2964696 RepID=UPI00286D3645